MRSRKITYRDRSPIDRRRDNDRRPDHYHTRRGGVDAAADEPRYNDRSPPLRRAVRRLSSEDRFDVRSPPRPLRPVRRLSTPPESGRIVFRGGRSNSPPPQNTDRGYLRRFGGDKEDDGIVGSRGSVRQPWNHSELDEKVSQRGASSFEYRHVNDEVNRSLKHVGQSENSVPRFRHGKEYQGIGSSSFDEGKAVLVPKPMYFEDGTMRTFFALPSEGSKNRNFLASSSGMTNVGLHKDEELRYRDQIHSNKMPMRESFGEAKPIYDEEPHYSAQMHPSRVRTRESYDEELKSVIYTRDAAYPMVPVSQSNTFSSTSLSLRKEDGVGSRFPVEGYGKGIGNFVDSLGRDANISASHSDPTRDEKDPTYYQRGVRSPLRHENLDYYHPEPGRRKNIDSGYRVDDLYQKMPSATQGDYRNRELSKASYMDPDPVDDLYREMPPTTQGDYHNREISRQSYMDPDFGRSLKSTRESDLLHHYTARGEPVSDYNNIKRAPLVPLQDRDFLGSGSNHLEIGTRISGGRKITSLEPDYAFEREAISRYYRERLIDEAAPEFQSDIYEHNLSPRQRLRVEELDNYGPSERMLKRDYIMEEEMSRRYPGSTLSSGRIISRRIQEPTGSDIQGNGVNPGRLSLSERLNFDRHQYRKGGKPHKRITTIGASSSDRFSSQNPLVHAQQRTGGHVSIKKRLRPGPFNSHHLDARIDSLKGPKSRRRTLNNPFDNLDASNGDAMEDALTPLKSDVPEDSEEFKLLVQRAFLRFSKQLNENPAQRKRYLEQGKCRVLCSVCGSLSKEFVDTQSLVRHAFTSLKVGLRADHLGLHKALCVLMRWKSSEVPDDRWSLQVLPDVEALSLKEDLILWPPQIIIHNSSILNENPDERKVVKIEEMEGILKDMGYGDGKTKVCRGKPANQSIMVVTFNSTFSGLQEAQRLHNYYTDRMRGREDFLRINSKGGEKSDETHGELANNVSHDFLYGYMGTAEDLDKLDFGSKSKCIVKSKKDIQTIAGAPLETD